MTNLNEKLNSLKEKLSDLQSNTRFCVNNWDYHHKNNEHEIIENLQTILEDAFQEDKELIDNLETVRSSINAARKKCNEIDELLEHLGYRADSSGSGENCPKGSESFHEEQVADEQFLNPLEENKENAH